jgi:hypothetical protein
VTYAKSRDEIRKKRIKKDYLNNLSLNIKTLPIEIFQDIWIKLDVTMYFDVKKIEEEVPTLKEYIRASVIELDFEEGIRAFFKGNQNSIRDVYPNIKYVDHPTISQINYSNIKEISRLNHLRNVKLVGILDFDDNVDSIHDIMINIIKRNKGNVKVSLDAEYRHNNLAYDDRTNIVVEYDNGIISASGNYLIEKIRQMRPEILAIKYPFNKAFDVLKLALLPSIKGLLMDININECIRYDNIVNTSRKIPNAYSIINALLYIDENDTEEFIKPIYQIGTPNAMKKKRENKIESIQYRYVNQIQDRYIEYDHDEYWFPLRECSKIYPIFHPVKIFPNLKYMSIPIGDEDMELWEQQIAPNVKHLRSEHDAYLEGLNKKIEELELNLNKKIEELELNLNGYKSHTKNFS